MIFSIVHKIYNMTSYFNLQNKRISRICLAWHDFAFDSPYPKMVKNVEKRNGHSSYRGSLFLNDISNFHYTIMGIDFVFKTLPTIRDKHRFSLYNWPIHLFFPLIHHKTRKFILKCSFFRSSVPFWRSDWLGPVMQWQYVSATQLSLAVF